MAAPRHRHPHGSSTARAGSTAAPDGSTTAHAGSTAAPDGSTTAHADSTAGSTVARAGSITFPPCSTVALALSITGDIGFLVAPLLYLDSTSVDPSDNYGSTSAPLWQLLGTPMAAPPPHRRQETSLTAGSRVAAPPTYGSTEALPWQHRRRGVHRCSTSVHRR
jgi:hypothetical protein